jgi:hydroxymethylglutaryl-CoA reductase (NADPH)
LAFSLPFDQVPYFWKAVQELPDPTIEDDEGEQKKWIMRAARGPIYGSNGAARLWLADAWSSFADLIKVFASDPLESYLLTRNSTLKRLILSS